MIVIVLAWLAVVAFTGCGAIAAAGAARAWQDHRAAARSAVTAAAAEGALAAGALGVAGFFTVPRALILGGVFLAVAGVLVLADERKPPKAIGDALAAATLTVQEAWHRRHDHARRPGKLSRGGRAPSRAGRPAAARAGRPAASPRPAPAIPGRRAVPPVRRDPALAGAPLSRSITDGPVTPAWQAVIAAVADFEPEDDTDFLDHWRENSTGLLGLADAMIDQADNLGVAGAGLAAAIISAVFDAAEVTGEAAGSFAAIRERLLSSYEGSREDVAAGHDLPKDGKFITGEEAA